MLFYDIKYPKMPEFYMENRILCHKIPKITKKTLKITPQRYKNTFYMVKTPKNVVILGEKFIKNLK